MPVVRIDMLEGRDRDVKRKLIQNVSKAVAESLGIELGWVQVVLNEVSKDNWGKDGEQMSRMK